MTSRRPLVVVAGQARQLPAGDTIAADAITSAIPRGTAFPLSPATNDLFHRTDLGVVCEWDGTRWLGPLERVPMPLWIGSPPFSVSPTWPTMVPIGSENLYVLSFHLLVTVQTTNNASNYWTIYAMNGGNSIGSVTTASYTVNAPTYGLLSINSALSGNGFLQIKIQKGAGAPGSMFISSAVKFRSIYT